MGDFVRADDHLEGVLEPGDAEPAHGAAPHLYWSRARGSSPGPAAPAPPRPRRHRAHQLVVWARLLRAVRPPPWPRSRRGPREVAELHPQRGAQPLHPNRPTDHTALPPRCSAASDDVWMQGAGAPALWVQFRHSTEDPAEIEAMVATYRAYNLAHTTSWCAPMPAWSRRCWALRDQGRPSGLVTSKMRAAPCAGSASPARGRPGDRRAGLSHPSQAAPREYTALERLGAPANGAVFVARLAPRPRVRPGRGVKTGSCPVGDRSTARIWRTPGRLLAGKRRDLTLLAPPGP